jgi:stage II sporulation protein GA (sporulation sigma-E factor processing peptidase)
MILVVTIYADILFLLNLFVDYLLLLITGRIAGIPLCRKRYWFASIFGGGYAVLAMTSGLRSVLTSVPLKLLVWFLISGIAYGRSRHLIKLTLLLGGMSSSLAGVVLAAAILFNTNPIILIPSLLVCSIVLFSIGTCFFHSSMQHHISGNIFPAKLSVAGNFTELPTLLDTGNHLKNPVTGLPLLIVSIHSLNSVLPPVLSQTLLESDLSNPSGLPELIRTIAPELNPQLIPYRSLGCSSGLLLTLQTDWIQIKTHRYNNAAVALAPINLGFGYSALWGGDLKGEF